MIMPHRKLLSVSAAAVIVIGIWWKPQSRAVEVGSAPPAADAPDKKVEKIWEDEDFEEFWKTQRIPATRWLSGHVDGVMDVVISDDAKHFITASHDGDAIMWDSATGKEHKRYR